MVDAHARLQIPLLCEYVSSSAGATDLLVEFLRTQASDPDFRMRMVAPAAICAVARSPISRSAFEASMVPIAVQLGSDKVAGVRIGVARLMGEVCLAERLYADPADRSTSISNLIKELADDTESVVRAFVAPFAPPRREGSVSESAVMTMCTPSSAPSSPIAIPSAASEEGERMDEDHDSGLDGSGVELLGISESESMDDIEIDTPTPTPKPKPIDLAPSTAETRRRSWSPPRMEVDPVDAAVAQTLESAVETDVFSRPPTRRRSSSPAAASALPKEEQRELPRGRSFHGTESLWMREAADADGFVEVGC